MFTILILRIILAERSTKRPYHLYHSTYSLTHNHVSRTGTHSPPGLGSPVCAPFTLLIINVPVLAALGLSCRPYTLGRYPARWLRTAISRSAVITERFCQGGGVQGQDDRSQVKL